MGAQGTTATPGVPGPEGAPRAAGAFLVACAEARLASEITSTLSQCGLAVQEVPTAGLAMDRIERTRPELVVLAHPLGEATAAAVCRRVRSNPAVGRTPILLVPDPPSRDAVLEGIRAGASDFLVKPIAPHTLLRKVAKALDGVGHPLSPAARVAVGNRIAPGLLEEAEVRTLGKIDLDKLVRKVDRLLALPAVVQRVIAITINDKTGARDLATAVESDPAVAAAVVKRANSAAYARGGRAFDVKESVVRLGFSLTRSLVVGLGVFRLFPRGQRTVGFDRAEAWRHSLAAGIVSRILAQRAAVPESDTAFLSGLLHDVGKLALDEFCPEDFERACLIALRDLSPLRDAERTVLETDHSRIGAAVLRAWRFPEAIVDAVGHHHDLSQQRLGIDPQQARLNRLVQVSDLLAKAFGEGNAGDLLLHELPSACWEEIGLGRGLPTSFARSFDEELARSRDFLGNGTPGAVPAVTEVAGAPSGAAATPDRPVLFLHEGQPPVSVLGLATERLGRRLVPVTEAQQARKLPVGSVEGGVVRASSPATLLAAAEAWRRTAALSKAPILGVLPQGAVAPDLPDGVTCLVEPYDRSALSAALP